jgi:hypothetical protein
VFWSKYSDSHEDIIKEFKLHEGTGGLTDNANFVRVEISPKGGKLNTPIKTWKYNLDQSVHPSWYDAEKVEQSCRKELKAWHEQKVILKDCVELSDGQFYVSDNATIESVSGNATIESVSGNATIEYVYDNATIESVYGNATIKYVYDNATIKYVYDNATIESVSGNATIESVYGNATIESVYDNATIKSVSGNAKMIKVEGSACAIVYTTIDPSCLKSDKAVMIDRSGKAVRVFTGGRELK